MALLRTGTQGSRRFGGTSFATLTPATFSIGPTVLLLAVIAAVSLYGGGFSPFVRAIFALPNRFGALLITAYDRAPALVAVLGALLLVPLIAVAGFAVDMIWSRERARPYAPSTDVFPTTVATAPVAAQVADRSESTEIDADARLVMDAGEANAFPLKAHMVRIGRHEESDLRLPERSVHRFHAVVHRTADSDYLVSDLSGADGNGVLVNGVRQDRCQLKHGDVIVLGETALRFERDGSIVERRPAHAN